MSIRPVMPALAALAAARFTMTVASLAMVGLVLPIAGDLGVTPARIALLVTVFSFTSAFASPLLQIGIGGWRLGALVILGLGGIAVGAALGAAAADLAMLAACQGLAALGGALVGPMTSAAGAGLVPAEQRGEALGTVFLGTTIGTVVGVPLASYVGAAFGWRVVMLGLALLAALSAAVVALAMGGGERGRRTSLRELGSILSDGVLAPAICISFLHMAAQFSAFTLIALLVTERFGLDAEAVPLVLLVFGCGGVAGNVLATRAMRRRPADRVLRTFLLGYVMNFLVLLAVSALLPAVSAQALLPAAAFALVGLWAVVSIGIIAPLQSHLVSLAPQSRTIMLSLSVAFASAGIGTGSALAGALAEWLGVGGLPVVSAGLATLAFLAFALSSRASRRRALAAAR